MNMSRQLCLNLECIASRHMLPMMKPTCCPTCRWIHDSNDALHTKELKTISHQELNPIPFTFYISFVWAKYMLCTWNSVVVQSSMRSGSPCMSRNGQFSQPCSLNWSQVFTSRHGTQHLRFLFSFLGGSATISDCS